MDFYNDDIDFYDTTDEEIFNILVNNIELVKDVPFQVRLQKILSKLTKLN